MYIVCLLSYDFNTSKKVQKKESSLVSLSITVNHCEHLTTDSPHLRIVYIIPPTIYLSFKKVYTKGITFCTGFLPLLFFKKLCWKSTPMTTNSWSHIYSKAWIFCWARQGWLRNVLQDHRGLGR